MMVSREDIDQMERLKQIMEGKKPLKSNVSNNRPNNQVGYEKDPKDDMADILKRMYGSNKKEIVETKQEVISPKQNLSQDEIVDRIMNGDNSFNKPKLMPDYNNESNNKIIDDNYQIIVELYPGSKIRKIYSITNNGNNTQYQNFQMFETAQLIIESLMRNQSSKIDLYIKKDKEFSDLIKESLFYKSKAEKSNQLNESEAERILLDKSKSYSNSAQKIQRAMRELISLF